MIVKKKIAHTDDSFEVENIFFKPGEFLGTISRISLMPNNSKWSSNFIPNEQIFALWFPTESLERLSVTEI